MNALKSGLFAQEDVIPSAGETQKDFDELRAAVFEQFPSSNATTALLVGELVSAAWRLRRVRRYEGAEMRRRLDLATIKKRRDDVAAVEELQIRFFGNLNPRPHPLLLRSREETRRELQTTSLGLKFLIGLIEPIRDYLESYDYMPEEYCVLLSNALGAQDEVAQKCLAINKMLLEEIEKRRAFRTDTNRKSEEEDDNRARDCETHDEPEAEDTNDPFKVWKCILLSMIKEKIQLLETQKANLETCEEMEDKAYLASLVLPPNEFVDRIHRAEGPLERRFYKALDRLQALQESDIS